MDVELFVHGVPSGEGFWGKEEDRNYFGTFYDHSSDEVKFLIQTRALKGKPYCYYNYLVYKTAGSPAPNVVANDGRDGSYFGLSLRLDAYCKDFVNMYRILDTVYNVYVIGTLLKMEKTKLKYTTPDFASVVDTLKTIENVTLQLIQKAFSVESFTKLDGFAVSGNNYSTYNLYDCTMDKVMAVIKQYGKVAISPYYQTNKEATLQQQCNAQIQSIQQQCEARLQAEAEARVKEKNEINISLSSAKNQVAQLQKDLGQKEDTINQQKSEIARLQTDIRNLGQNKKIAHIVAPIKDPIIELAKVLQITASTSTDDNGNDEKRKNPMFKTIKAFMPFVNFILLLFVIGVLLNPFNIFSKKDVRLNGENDSTENKGEQNLSDPISSSSNTITDAFPTFVTDFDIESVKIDIKQYKGSGKLKRGIIYDVEAINGIEGGIWNGEGCDLTLTNNPNMVQLCPTADTVRIIYQVGNKNKIREIPPK